MKTVCYLAGAMEIYGSESSKAKQWREFSKKWFERYCDDFKIISPPDYYEYGRNYQKSDREIFNFDLRSVKNADVILVNLKYVRKSVGTCMELKEANTYNVPIVGFIEEMLTKEDLIQLIHPWVYCCCDRIETGTESLELALAHIKSHCVPRRY